MDRHCGRLDRALQSPARHRAFFAENTMRKTLLAGVLLLATAFPATAQVYHPNEPLGKTLSKIKSLSMPNNAGGKDILENSCIFKNDFSISASEQLLDHCNVSEAIGQFTSKNGQPDQTSQAPGNLTVLEYYLLANENAYHVKFFIGCEDAKTTFFVKAECINEKNRVMPGGPSKGHGGPGGHPGGRP
jgi:hypothetical protein